jgi:hypothetical protein
VAFDEGLADRIRELLGSHEGLSERKMFGGIAFMLNGNMAVGVIGAPQGTAGDSELASWVESGAALAESLPPKS